MAVPNGVVCLEGNNELCGLRCELYCDSRDSGRELCNGGMVTHRGRYQVFDGVYHLLLEVPVVRVCGGVVRGLVGGTRLVLNQEAPLPVGGGKKHF